MNVSTSLKFEKFVEERGTVIASVMEFGLFASLKKAQCIMFGDNRSAKFAHGFPVPTGRVCYVSASGRIMLVGRSLNHNYTVCIPMGSIKSIKVGKVIFQ